jgi:uncharacterized repeat protein (TIGR01451 family)
MLALNYKETSLLRFSLAAVLVVLGALLFAPGLAHAWPAEADWIPLVNSTGFIEDPDQDYNQCHLDIVGDSSNPAAMIYNDGTHIYYRIRLNCDPSGQGGLKANTWGILIDTDQNADAYEWMVRIDGRSNNDEIVISQNTSQGTLGDPSDSAEVDVWSEALDSTPGSENYKITTANTSFPNQGDPTDYWLEFRYPYDKWLHWMGLDDSSVIRYFVGTGPSGWTLSGDIVGTSLYTDLSNPILPSGTEPTTGYVMFVSDLSGAGDVTSAYPGDTLYIKVEDADQNDQKTAADTLTVTVATTAGDSETVILTETGLSTGIFTGSVASADAAFTIGNGTVDMSPIETVFVTYIDAVDAALNKDRDRIDSLTAMPSADIGVTVGVSNTTPNEGEVLAFTLTLTNHGQSDASGLQITDLMPSGLIYNSDDGSGLYNPVNGVWSVPSLLDGEVKTLIINATVDTGTSGTTIVDNVDITYNPQLDPVGSNDSDSVTLTVQGADLSLSMTVSDSTPNETDLITYTLTLVNNGTNNATGLIINDVLPTGVTYDSSVPALGTYDGSTWSGFDLPNGSSTTLTIDATVDNATSGQIITHFANVASAGQADPVASNNNAIVSIAVGGVDLNLTKSVDIAAPNVGQNIVYTVTLLNQGGNTANAVEVTDLLPSGVTYVSYATTPAATGAYVSATGIWDGFSLAAGASVSLDITAIVDSGTGDSTIVNNAQVTGVTESEVDPSDDADSASITVQSADLDVTKTVDNASPDPSAEVAFTITLTNNGPDTATSVELTDTMSAGLTYVSHTISPPATGTYTSGTGIWDGFDLTSGSSVTLVINATVPATVGTVETNTIAVTALDQEDSVSGNDTASVDVTVGGVDLQVTKTVDNPSPGEGDTITYTIVIDNVGDFPATGIELLDALPGGVTYNSSSATQAGYATNDDLWNTLSIINGASETLTITAIVDAGTNGNTIENTARLVTVDQTDIDITNNLDKVTIYVGSTDLGITKSVSDPTPNVGDTVTYTLTVTNNGLNNATGVDVTDILPSGVTYLIDNSSGYYNDVSGIWNVTNAGFTELLPGASRSLTIDAFVDPGTGGQTIINNAQITATDQLDPDSSNDFTSVSLTVQSADISILKVADDATPLEEGMVSFTLTVTNNGPHDATGITVQDVLPAGLTYDSDDGSGAYVQGTGIWSVSSLAKDASVSLIINATADLGTGGTTITNIANIVSADQVDYGVAFNNTSSFDISPTVIPYPDLKMTKAVLTFWDPVSLSSGDQKAIPGAVMLYTISVSNEGDGSPNTNSVVIDEIVPANTEMYVVGGGITEDLADSGLTILSIEYADISGFGYTPDEGLPGGYDPAVTNFRITMAGDFNVSSGTPPHPHFDISFKVRIK